MEAHVKPNGSPGAPMRLYDPCTIHGASVLGFAIIGGCVNMPQPANDICHIEIEPPPVRPPPNNVRALRSV